LLRTSHQDPWWPCRREVPRVVRHVSGDVRREQRAGGLAAGPFDGNSKARRLMRTRSCPGTAHHRQATGSRRPPPVHASDAGTAVAAG
jgi:hypothetical protein